MCSLRHLTFNDVLAIINPRWLSYPERGMNPLVLGLAAVALVSWIIYHRKRALPLPGPTTLPIVGNLLQMDYKRPFITLHKWYGKYGNVYRVNVFGKEVVVVSGYDELYEVLVTRGMDFAGRNPSWRIRYAYQCKGIAHSVNPDDQWRDLRRICHSHTRECATESEKLRPLLGRITHDMIQNLTSDKRPYDVILAATIRSLATLILGINISEKDPLFAQLKDYSGLSSENLSFFGDWSMVMVEKFPLLRYVGFKAIRNLRKVQLMENDIWQEIKERIKGRKDRISLGRLLLDAVDFPAKFKSISDQRITDFDAQRTAFSICIAGIATITNSFHSIVHIIATNQTVQLEIKKEIKHYLGGEEREITMTDRPGLPYTRATILEAYRYCSIAAFGRIHRAAENTQIGDIHIRQNTTILPNLWSVHHDDSFWDDPDEFRPQRFLDDSRQLVPADHPNRRHLLPFGAGPRMCVGENLATARLFVWTANLVYKYHVALDKPRDKAVLTCRDHVLDGGIVVCPPYTLCLTEYNMNVEYK